MNLFLSISISLMYRSYLMENWINQSQQRRYMKIWINWVLYEGLPRKELPASPQPSSVFAFHGMDHFLDLRRCLVCTELEKTCVLHFQLLWIPVSCFFHYFIHVGLQYPLEMQLSESSHYKDRRRKWRKKAEVIRSSRIYHMRIQNKNNTMNHEKSQTQENKKRKENYLGFRASPSAWSSPPIHHAISKTLTLSSANHWSSIFVAWCNASSILWVWI